MKKIMIGALLCAVSVANIAQAKILADRMFAFANQTLVAGDKLYAGNTDHYLIMQGDCNLVLYRAVNVGQPSATWSSGTANKGTECHADMQGDGNLVVYDKNKTALWSSRTNGNTDDYLVMQDDGNLVIYNDSTSNSPIWASNTENR